MRVVWLLGLVACGGREATPDWQQQIASWHYEDPLPSVPLVDQDGKARTLGDFRGAYLLIGFIYTACPKATACPMTTASMASILRAHQHSAGAPALHLLSLTLDPERDTPQTLSAYAETHGIDTTHWTFATGEPALMHDGLPSLFNVLSLTDVDGTIDHTVKLALLDPSGRQVAEWKDNAVSPQQVLTAMQAATP